MNLRRWQGGQATVEFVVLSLALVPLVLMVPLAGKYLDMMQTAESASRYVAFEGAVHHSSTGWKSDATLADEVRRRFFSRSDASVKTGDVAHDIDDHRNMVWRDHAGRVLIDDFAAQVAVSSTRQGFNFYGPTRWAWRNGLDLPEDNLTTGTVTLRPKNIPGLEPFDAIDLRITRRTGVLVDSWAARSAGHVRQRIEDRPLVYPMSELEPVVQLIGMLPLLLTDEPLQPGLRTWDRVPCDRLAEGC
jgi:hypothetical protein